MEQEEVWDKIAKKWDSYRREPVAEVRKFMSGKKGKILDLGCGSGRNFMKNKNIEIFGIDFSSELLKLAGENAEKFGVELKKSEVSNIPYKDNFFDAGIFVRVLHCIKDNEAREKSLKELFRVLKPDAEAVISVWSRKQDRIKNKDKVCLVPWTVENKKYMRYTYIYDVDELTKLLETIGFKIINLEENKNIVIIVRKPSSN